MSRSERMPVAFFGHGSPTNVLDDNAATRAWAEMARRIGKPTAILIVSAHWCTQGTKVTAMAAPKTIHDFGRSLPSALFDQQYAAPGSVQLAERVADLLRGAGAELDHCWGLDHGSWSVLAKAYPEADIPVVQLSMDVTKAEAWHHDLARHLRPLRDEGVLIAASGNIVHNLGVLNWRDDAEPYPWAVSFNDYIKGKILANDVQAIVDFRSRGQEAKLSVPSEDHFWPLFYALGASEPGDEVTFYSDYIVYSSLGMTSVLFGS